MEIIFISNFTYTDYTDHSEQIFMKLLEPFLSFIKVKQK